MSEKYREAVESLNRMNDKGEILPKSLPLEGFSNGAPPSKQPDFRTQVFQAAERTNQRYGQWMPQQWLEIFIGEMMKEPE